ncbi:MAG: cytidylyltransferase domain-containing protein [Planctomycetota bacterium]|jgi:spore coat polysaccharide biosynthesis protein SpsF (cytidylyltransferase family)
MRIGAIIQARMSSRRLPGKVLRALAGRPVLAHVLDRVGSVQRLDAVAVATSTDPGDDGIADFCCGYGATCLRGPLADVARRFRLAAEALRVDAFVRICADSPLIDPALIDRAVAALGPGVDLVTNVFPRTYPPGQAVEVVRTAAFTAAEARMTEPADREHVTRYFYRNASAYRIRNLRSDRDYGTMRLAVDTAADLQRLETLLGALDLPLSACGLDDLAPAQPLPAG